MFIRAKTRRAHDSVIHIGFTVWKEAQHVHTCKNKKSTRLSDPYWLYSLKRSTTCSYVQKQEEHTTQWSILALQFEKKHNMFIRVKTRRAHDSVIHIGFTVWKEAQHVHTCKNKKSTRLSDPYWLYSLKRSTTCSYVQKQEEHTTQWSILALQFEKKHNMFIRVKTRRAHDSVIHIGFTVWKEAQHVHTCKNKKSTRLSDPYWLYSLKRSTTCSYV